jgi:hypothetical protein
VDGLVDVPPVDTFSGTSVNGILRHEVAVVTQDGFGEVDHRRSVDQFLEESTPQEHQVPDDAARAAGRIRLRERFHDLVP